MAPERKLFYGNFWYLALSSLYWNQRLNFAKFVHALVLFTLCFVAPEQKLFYGHFLLPDSAERVLEHGA